MNEERTAEKDVPTATVEIEYGVRLGDSPTVVNKGVGYWARRHAEQEVERIAHNATLPFVGQPTRGTVVQRAVTRYYNATDWTPVIPPVVGETP